MRIALLFVLLAHDTNALILQLQLLARVLHATTEEHVTSTTMATTPVNVCQVGRVSTAIYVSFEYLFKFLSFFF